MAGPAPEPAPQGVPAAAEQAHPLIQTPQEPPLGFAGSSGIRPRAVQTSPDFIPIEDRWRLGFPSWDRYERRIEAPYVKGHWWDPYNQNVLKGDYPIVGQHTFLNISAISDTLIEGRRIPLPSNVSAANPDRAEFFGSGDQFFLNQNFIFSFELFHGDTAFKPRDWEFRITPVFNINYLSVQETGVVNIDVREGTMRTDGHVGIQDLFVEYHLGDLSPAYDFVSARAGIQGFTSDFRGFIFSDNTLAFRLFGNLQSNRNQWNLVYLSPLEKDTNSGLNTSFITRGQHIAIANFFRQDFLWPGYTAQLSFHYLHDDGGIHFDRNGFLVRPAAVGIVKPHTLDVVYLGWTGDGHIGPLNISHAFYQVLGHDDRNPIAGRPLDVSAQMVAVELSIDFDWLRPKASFFWASGDSSPTNGHATGFDAIFDNPNFAGAGFSYWNRQALPLTSTGLELVGRNSLLPSLRSSKIEGQPNFVNPGLFLLNLGADVELTPKLRALVNLNLLRFHRTESLELLLFQPRIRHDIGLDYSLGFQYRPFLNENVVITAGAAALTPGDGLKDVYTSTTFRFGEKGLEIIKQGVDTLYSVFAALTLTY
ncbi:MAG: hypothetical protein HY278_03000 [candidate division NC10 bacterium]|nr:hypothetical protein [candidate division NC10 bacterium]